jgi:hypothetical protein
MANNVLSAVPHRLMLESVNKKHSNDLHVYFIRQRANN